MVFRIFDVEDTTELAAAGLDPQPLEDGDVGGVVRWRSGAKSAEMTYDVPGRSIRLKVYSDEHGLELDIFREGATRLRSNWKTGSISLHVWFEVDGLAGVMELGLLPSIYLRDSMLFT